jgi:hypothetical protein
MPGPIQVTMQHQEQPYWCWAAVAASLSSAMPLTPSTTVMSQCDLAQNLVCAAPSNCCCANGHPQPPGQACDTTTLIENALDAIGHRGDASGSVPSPNQVTIMIGNGQPIVGEIQWSDGQLQKHYVLIVDYETNSLGDFVVKVADPSDPTGTLAQDHSLDELQNGGYRSSGTWVNTYFTQ